MTSRESTDHVANPAETVAARDAVDPGWEVFQEHATPGLFRRFWTSHRHIFGMLVGALVAHVRARKAAGGSRVVGFGFWLQRVFAGLFGPFLDKSLRDLPFPVQFRRRLEILGPTYIKLGQILSLREDLLPPSITEELKNLLDRLPAVPYSRYLELISEGLGRPQEEMFAAVDREPVGSASIAQTHMATTIEGDRVILKVVKPGIAEILKRDAVLLKMGGGILQIFLSRFQPRRVIEEFCDYTLREVDLRLEADNAEQFAQNFKDSPGIVFPKIYRDYSGERVLCMEFFAGVKPNSPEARALTEEERMTLIDQGASAIIRMLYKDGFFHADLHPGNLIVLPGPKCGFIDLGMIGRFDDQLRRTLLYYYYCLVMKDAENAARYLTAVAETGPRSDPEGFRKQVEDVSRRWSRAANFAEFSLAQLILESVGKAGQFRVYFPVEMVLMVKALVTFEGVGQILKPGFDVAEVSQRHINRIFFSQFNPLRLAKESLRGAPEMVDALVKAPLLITEGLKFLEQSTKPRPNPLTGLRTTVMAGFCVVAGAILAAAGGTAGLWVGIGLFLLAVVLFFRQGD